MAAKPTENFPELWRYTFPELATTLRYPTPMIPRTMANYAATFGFRHDLEVRYAPNRTYVLEGKVPTKADYGIVNSKPDVEEMHRNDSAAASAYLKAVCDFQCAHAKYLLAGCFVDVDGFACTNARVVAVRAMQSDFNRKRFGLSK